jgi:hypothetical protein
MVLMQKLAESRSITRVRSSGLGLPAISESDMGRPFSVKFQDVSALEYSLSVVWCLRGG